MATINASVERKSSSRIRPVKRPLVPQLLTFFTILQPVSIFLIPALKEQPIKEAYRKHPLTPSPIPPPTPPPSPRQLDNILIDALAKTYLCRQHPRASLAQAIFSSPRYMYHKTRRRNRFDAGRHIRHLHRAAVSHVYPATLRSLSRDDYLSILDYYRESYSTQASSTSNKESDEHPPPGVAIERQPTRKEDKRSMAHLLLVLNKSDCTHEEAFEAYSALTFPGVSYLSHEMRRVLFRRLSVMEKKTRAAKMRYLSVVDDMKAANLPMIDGEWNSAIAFCGQCFGHLTAVEVENALRTWTEMEREANIKGRTVTFNILFDMAAKAGKFVLAEMILKEMEDRKLKYNRFSRNAFIFYHGLRGDGDAVRRAYRDFVEAGEIVDTVVMNTVITALIQAGEPAAAEQVYERMKQMHTKQTGHVIPPGNWRQVRDLGRVLNSATARLRDNPKQLRQVQEQQSLAPDTQTYLQFVEYHASKSGEIRRIATLLAEMQHQGLPMHGRMFTKLFKGFAYHGGVRYSSWNRPRLEAVWASMLEAVDQEMDNVRVMKWLVVWAVRAFERCAGRQRTLEIWNELKSRWKPEDGDVDFVIPLLRGILNSGDHR